MVLWSACILKSRKNYSLKLQVAPLYSWQKNWKQIWCKEITYCNPTYKSCLRGWKKGRIGQV